MSFDPHHFYTNRRRRSTRNGQIIQKKPVARTPIYSSSDLPGLLSAVRAFGYESIPRSLLIPFPFSYSEVHSGVHVLTFYPLVTENRVRLPNLMPIVRTDFDQLFNLNLYHPVDGTFQMHVEIRVFSYSLLFASATDSRILSLTFAPSNFYAKSFAAGDSGVLTAYVNNVTTYACAFASSTQSSINDNDDKSALASIDFDGGYTLYQQFKNGDYGGVDPGNIVLTNLSNSISRICCNFEIFISVSYKSQWWLGNQ